jgi:beta-lactamase class A
MIRSEKGGDKIFMGKGVLKSGLILTLAGALSGCVAATAQPPRAQHASVQRPFVTVPPPRPVRPLPPRPPQGLVQSIDRLGQGFAGDVGIAVVDVERGWIIDHNGSRSYPQQSVSKLWVAIAALDAVDRGALDLSERRTVTRDDLTVFHQPIRALIGANGHDTNFRTLMFSALQSSDNTANDILLRRIGGPTAVREMIAAKKLGAINFGEGERLLQSEIAGLEWRQAYAVGQEFYRARAALPMERRNAAMQRYLERPMDGATPIAMTNALARLARGELLTPASTRLLLNAMEETRTGPQRLKAGLSPGWRLAHKTGTGQNLNGMTAGYNDVGIITAPGGHRYAVAVLIGNTRQGIPARQRLMNEVVRAVIAQHNANASASRASLDAPAR